MAVLIAEAVESGSTPSASVAAIGSAVHLLRCAA
jgi:hypothetical protein